MSAWAFNEGLLVHMRLEPKTHVLTHLYNGKNDKGGSLCICTREYNLYYNRHIYLTIISVFLTFGIINALIQMGEGAEVSYPSPTPACKTQSYSL